VLFAPSAAVARGVAFMVIVLKMSAVVPMVKAMRRKSDHFPGTIFSSIVLRKTRESGF
jgi:hypothetical protein